MTNCAKKGMTKLEKWQKVSSRTHIFKELFCQLFHMVKNFLRRDFFLSYTLNMIGYQLGNQDKNTHNISNFTKYSLAFAITKKVLFRQYMETHIIKQVGGSVGRPSLRHKACKRHPIQNFNEEVILWQWPLTQKGSLWTKFSWCAYISPRLVLVHISSIPYGSESQVLGECG